MSGSIWEVMNLGEHQISSLSWRWFPTGKQTLHRLVWSEKAVWFDSGLQPGKHTVSGTDWLFVSVNLLFSKKKLDWQIFPYLKKEMSVRTPGITRMHMTIRDHSVLSSSSATYGAFERDAYWHISSQWRSHKSRMTERLHIKPTLSWKYI